jgi:hypothetical protein
MYRQLCAPDVKPTIGPHGQVQLFDEAVAGFVFTVQNLRGHVGREEPPRPVEKLLILGGQVYRGKSITERSSWTARELRQAWFPRRPESRPSRAR